VQVRKSVFLRHFHVMMIILPRQARDKHRENSTRHAFSYRSSSPRSARRATCRSTWAAVRLNWPC
jgi:hypothetical protein